MGAGWGLGRVPRSPGLGNNQWGGLPRWPREKPLGSLRPSHSPQQHLPQPLPSSAVGWGAVRGVWSAASGRGPRAQLAGSGDAREG